MMLPLTRACEFLSLDSGLPRPTWDLRNVRLGWGRWPEDRDLLMAATVGFGDPLLSLLDDVRFDATSRHLVALNMHVPENPVDCPGLMERIRQIEPSPVTALWRPDSRGNGLAECSSMWVDDQCETLVCWAGEVPSGSLRVLEIAPELYLFDGESPHEQGWGWVLTDPVAVLVSSLDGMADGEKELPVRMVVRDYLRTFSDSFVEALEDGESGAVATFGDLKRRARALAVGEAAQALVARLGETEDCLGPFAGS